MDMLLVSTRDRQPDRLSTRRQQQTVIGNGVSTEDDDIARLGIYRCDIAFELKVDAGLRKLSGRSGSQSSGALPATYSFGRFGRSTGGAESALSIMMLTRNWGRLNMSAAAKPAAPPPTITILPGASTDPLPRGFGCSRFCRTKIWSPSCSTRQTASAVSAGARVASPMRKSKQA
jgi:hypothetical protein